MDLIGGKTNPILRSTKFRKIQKTNIGKEIINESTSNVSSSANAANVSPIGSKNPIISDVTYRRRLKKSGLIKEFRTTNMINNPELVIIRSNNKEKELLGLAGLNIESNDCVITVKDRLGQIKSALSLKFENEVVNRVSFIDVDPKGYHFKETLVRLATLPNKPFEFGNKIESEHNSIKSSLIK